MSAVFLNQKQKEYNHTSDRQTSSLDSVFLLSHPSLRDRGSGRMVVCSGEIACT